MQENIKDLKMQKSSIKENKQISFKNKTFEVDGERVNVDYNLHSMLNILANKFYLLNGYDVNDDSYDFFESSHPQENLMYILALTAYVFNLTHGLD